MLHQIMQQVSIGATGVGILASAYYYGYSWMQIPIAIALDRYSTRYVLFVCALICGVSTLVFTYTENWYLACLSRFLIGVGSAVGFLGTSKVISEWFPRDQYARIIGFSFTFGLMGAIYGGKPVSLLVETYPWKAVAFTLACLSISLGIGAYMFLRSPKSQNPSQEIEAFKFTHFKQILSSPVICFLALANFLMVGSLEGFADVWGVSYLMKAYGLNKGDAAELVSFIFIGMLFGGPLLASISKKLGSLSVISICGVGMAFCLMLLLMSFQYNWYWIAGLLFCIGVLCCYQVIVFSAGADIVNPQLLCVTIAFLNCVNMLGGSFFHTCIGFIINIFWTGTFEKNGVKYYTLESYEMGLMIIPICALVGACVVGFMDLKRKNIGGFKKEN